MNKLTSLLPVLVFSLQAFSAEVEVSLPGEAPYYDKTIIQENVQRECTSLGSDLSSHIAEALEASGYRTNRGNAVDANKGIFLDVKITNLHSSGNAFLGHHKNLTAIARINKDGQTLLSQSFTRGTRGGFAAGFKGSCEVLDRAAAAVGRDIAGWFKAQRSVYSAAPPSPAASAVEAN